MRQIMGQVDLIVARHVANAVLKERYQGSNFILRLGALDQVTYMNGAANPTWPDMVFWPWRPPAGYDGQSLTVRHCTLYAAEGGDMYPPQAGIGGTLLNTRQLSRLRAYNSAAQTLAAERPKTIGAVCTFGKYNGAIANGQASLITFSEVVASQFGTTFVHPVLTGTITTTSGASYVTTLSATLSTWMGLVPHAASVLRIESGSDKGVYLIRRIDRTNNRLYLLNLDGTLFTASASATLVPVSAGARMSYFNEVGVIPNGTGQVEFDGKFNPGENRASYIFRIRFEKAGSPSPTDPSQTGSYWFGVKPFHHGDGILTDSIKSDRDNGMLSSGRIVFDGGTAPRGIANSCSAGFAGGSPGMVLDRTNQRLWMLANNNSVGSIAWWRYKTPEQLREVATSSGSPNDPISGIDMTGAAPQAIDIGSDDTVYIALSGGTKAGWVKITSGLVATQVLSSAKGLGTACNGLRVDRSRARAGGANTVTTTAGTDTLECSDGAFTDADLGRFIEIVGGADAGVYKISARSSGTVVTVQTTAGGAVSFTGQAATGTWRIGDRIYLFFGDTTSSPAGTITYFESLEFGTVATAAMGGGVVKGAQLGTWQANAYGAAPAIDVDQSNGVIYWASDDTAWQVNRYDPATNTWSRRLLSDFNGLNGGAGTIVDPTRINCLGVNPHASFRELWIGTDAGWVKLDPDSFAGSFSKYYGSGSDATPYSKPAGYARPDGSLTSNANTRSMRHVHFGPDGHVFGMAKAAGTSNADYVQYHREADVWTIGQEDAYELATGANNYVPGLVATPYGEIVEVIPDNKATTKTLLILTAEIQYQWIGSAWVAKEIVRGALPDATSSPGLSAKDLHTGLEELVMGMYVKFTPQGGATPANNEFLGRAGVTGADRADGATTLGANTFDGSAFVSGDAGRYLRIHSGADAGVYRIASYVNANRVTLSKLNPGTAWTATATAGSLTYSVWDMANAGPESASTYAAWGIARDNTQDITNIIYEFFIATTVLSEQVEAMKFMINPPGPAGSGGPAVYFESYAKTLNPNYSPNIPQGLALPGSPLANGLQLLDGSGADVADGTYGRANTLTPSVWSGLNPAAGTTGIAVSIDLGASAEVGALIIRCKTDDTSLPLALYTDTQAQYGSVFNVHSAPDSGAPAAASVVRASGTGLSLPASSTTVTLGSGDFLGSLTTSAADGQTAAGTSRFTSAIGRFASSDVGSVLKITSGIDAGSYRILSVAVDGSYCDIRNLNQSTKTFAATASSLTFEVRDAVREDDILSIPSGVGTHKLTVERLLTTTTAQVRCYATTTLTSQTWDALKPTWTLVKRVSHSVEAQPPNVVGNLTHITLDGQETNEDSSFKLVLDFSDLTTAQRSGRYWKVSGMPRFTAGTGSQKFSIHSFELYSPTGDLLTVAPYEKVDTVDSEPTFMASHITRVDIIQASDSAASHIAGANGLADLGGTYGDTVTLAGGNRFLGYEVRAGANGSAVGGNANFDCTGADPGFLASDIGRLLRIAAGANAGYYRIATVPSSTQVTLTTPAGNSVTLVADAGPTAYSIHEGINVGTTPDYLAFTTGGIGPTVEDLAISAISDDLTTITLAAKQFTTLASQNWEIRRRAAPSTATGTDAAAFARLLYISNAAPRQSGDIAQDPRGHLAFHSTDVGANTAKTNGATTATTDTFDGSGFTPDDVGRVLVVTSGADKGAYEIDTYVGTTQITVKNLYTGAAVSFAATAGSLGYYKTGERRFRASRYATVLRT